MPLFPRDGADALEAPDRLPVLPLRDLVVFPHVVIPLLVGRLPVSVPLEALDEEALVRILKEPKNALTKQYVKLFELENVKITFEETALRAIAQKALKRGTGARGLRAILEEILTDIMFDLPGREDVTEVKIIESTVTQKAPPLLEISPVRRKKEA